VNVHDGTKHPPNPQKKTLLWRTSNAVPREKDPSFSEKQMTTLAAIREGSFPRNRKKGSGSIHAEKEGARGRGVPETLYSGHSKKKKKEKKRRGLLDQTGEK